MKRANYKLQLINVIIIFVIRVGIAPVNANVLGNPPYVVDGIKIIEGSEPLLNGAQLHNIRPLTDKTGIELHSSVTSGSIVLAPVTTEFPFNEAIPSWNGWAPPEGGFRVFLRVNFSDAHLSSHKPDWTPWIEAGTWGNLSDEATTRTTVFPDGYYELDTLFLDRTAYQFQFRVDLYRTSLNAASPFIRLLALSFTNSRQDKHLWQEFGDKRPSISLALNQLQTTETLNIPFRSQEVPNPEWIPRICQTAAVCMALEYFGIYRPTEEIAAKIYDPVAKRFGIWHRSVQAAAQEGVRGYIRRFRNWDDVRTNLNQNAVICASIRFKLGELHQPPPPYHSRGTAGHIIVIKGFAPDGRVVTNDSGSKKYGKNELWLQTDLAKAWFDKGGVAFVFTGKQ
ncbi:MAG: C39 family peptidase [Candidatus Sumerlaeia bacterium]|nr:C39 family peptidase [Candidatus Sumerlaeia bacterium]